jgi:putative ABC transport system permease protein
MNYPLFLVSIGYIRKHLLQNLLLVIGIAFGVALVVSVDIANQSASRSFTLSKEMLSTKSTHRISGAYSDFDENIYNNLKLNLGIRNIAPIVEDYVNMVQYGGRAVRILGTDFFADLIFYDNGASPIANISQNTLSELMTRPNTGLISRKIAEEAGIDAGSVVELSYGSKTLDIEIVGLLGSKDDELSESLGGLLLTDISTAQELLGKVGSLSQIDLFIDENTPAGIEDLGRIQKILPPVVEINKKDNLLGSTESITRSFELNLTALSLLALFVGVFLIYNIVSFSVIQRRSIIGTLRSIGVTRRQIFKMVLVEALIIGALGSIVGVIGGILLGRGIVELVTGTINDLYFTLTVTSFTVSLETIFKGMLAGVIAALIAAIVPAYEASRIHPINVLRRSELEKYFIKTVPFLTLCGLVFIGLGFILIILPTKSLVLSLTSVFFILFGTSLVVPVCTAVTMRFFSLILSRTSVIGRMAPRNIIRSTSRTGVAIASLAVAISVILSVSIMIGSFRTTVVSWLDTVLTADIFVSMPSQNISSQAGIDPALRAEVENFPGIDRVATVRRVLFQSPRYGPFNLVAVTEDLAAKNRRFIWNRDDNEKLWDQMRDSSVLVSQSFAYRNGINPGPGSVIELPTEKGVKEFEIAGVYYDYGSQTGVVLISDDLFRSNWNDGQINSLGVYIAPGIEVDKTANELRAFLSKDRNLIVRSNTVLRKSAINTFDRTFTVTSALRILIAIVAFISVLSSFMALQLERGREFGVFRALGMTVSQLRGMVFLENGLIGLTAGLFSIPLGVALSLILIYVINLRSFGWTLDFVIKPQYFAEVIIIALIAAITAGIYPAYRLGKEDVGNLIREE